MVLRAVSGRRTFRLYTTQNGSLLFKRLARCTFNPKQSRESEPVLKGLACLYCHEHAFAVVSWSRTITSTCGAIIAANRLRSPSGAPSPAALAGEVILRAEHTKDRENRIVPISSRLRRVLEMRRDSPAGVPFPPSACVSGDAIGQRVGNVRRAWTAVLRAHGDKPGWIWKKKTGPNDKGSTRLSPESEAAYR
jgi:hypothetical protein